LKVEKKVIKYAKLGKLKPSKASMMLMFFEETHGHEALLAMGRFIDKAEKEGQDDDKIMRVIIHDITACKDKKTKLLTSKY